MDFREIYLSGTMEGRPYEEVELERVEARELLTSAGFGVCDPLRHKHAEIKAGKTIMNLAKTTFEVQQIESRDEFDVLNSDAILILTGDTPTSGTWFEFALSYYSSYFGKKYIPRVVIAPKLRKRMDEKGGAFEWTGAKASKVVSNIEEAVNVFKWMFGDRLYLPHSMDVRR